MPHRVLSLQDRPTPPQVNAPIPMKYQVEIPKDVVSVIALDIVLDEDPHYRGFNLTANGPQETARRRAWDTAAAGPQAGEMFQALEVHCGLVKPGSRCEVLQKEQIVSADGKSRAQGFSLTENVTYCNDSTYSSSDSPMHEILNMSDGFFRNGLMSQVCTRNENGTEIYNVTAYNYSCLPPCTPTLFTYQVLAEGCIYNCTNQRPDLDFMPECLNTYGLYPEEYLCVGGRYHGQHCLDLADIASCYDQEAKSSCERRDDMPGIQGPDPKAHFNKDDPSVFVRGVHYGDLHFVDWLHRGARVKWNEVATEVAAALGYMGILEYMLRNGAPWRRPAIEAARMRGRWDVVTFLERRLPPLGNPNPACGCKSLVLHPSPLANERQCMHWSTQGGSCIQRCGVDRSRDYSCRDPDSNFLEDDKARTPPPPPQKLYPRPQRLSDR